MTIAKAEREEIIAMRKQGKTIESIAELTQHQTSTIRKICSVAMPSSDGKPPRLYPADGRWVCEGQGSTATGRTKEHAFTRWEVARKQADAAKERHAIKVAAAEAKRRAEAAAKTRIAPPRTAQPWRDLVIPVFVKRQHDRAAAVQPPMKSMASTVHGIWVTEL